VFVHKCVSTHQGVDSVVLDEDWSAPTEAAEQPLVFALQATLCVLTRHIATQYLTRHTDT